MNQKEIQEIANFLGVSPFDIVGVLPGDLFKSEALGTTYEFIKVSRQYPSIGVFMKGNRHEFEWGPYVTFLFSNITPVEPYRINLEDLHEPETDG